MGGANVSPIAGGVECGTAAGRDPNLDVDVLKVSGGRSRPVGREAGPEN
jgi:hypothetical protein